MADKNNQDEGQKTLKKMHKKALFKINDAKEQKNIIFLKFLTPFVE